MNRAQLAVAAVALMAMLSLSVARPARADDAPLKIAVCNSLKVATQIQEYKDLVEKSKADRASLESQLNDRNQKIKAMQDELKLLLPDSAQYAEKNKALLNYRIEVEVWAKTMQLDLARKEKQSNKLLFDKIQATVAQIAKDRGITLVIADRSRDLPENVDDIPPDTLTALLLDRTILYTDSKLDITQDVVIVMDKAYAGTGH